MPPHEKILRYAQSKPVTSHVALQSKSISVHSRLTYNEPQLKGPHLFSFARRPFFPPKIWNDLKLLRLKVMSRNCCEIVNECCRLKFQLSKPISLVYNDVKVAIRRKTKPMLGSVQLIKQSDLPSLTPQFQPDDTLKQCTPYSKDPKQVGKDTKRSNSVVLGS